VLFEVGIPNERIHEINDIVEGLQASNRLDVKSSSDIADAEQKVATTQSAFSSMNFLTTLINQASQSTNLDWTEWTQTFAITLFKESPSPSLAACQNLAAFYTPFARKLFNTAFVACWTKMPAAQRVRQLYVEPFVADTAQDSFLDSLHNVITGHRDFMIQIVHVAEFMTHHHPEKVALLCFTSAA
jgi:phosphatidylinositol kinase/protein kinase (PI-3  family)